MEKIQKESRKLIDLFNKKKFQDAITYNNSLIKKYPKNVFFYNFLGLIYISVKQFENAIDIFKKGVNVNNNYGPLYDNLGTVYKLLGKNLEAENFYKKSIDIDKKTPEPRNNLGNLYILLNRTNEAIEMYQKAINVNPNFIISYYNLGNLYKSTGNFAKAKMYFNNVLEKNPFFFNAHRSLSQLTKYEVNNEHLKKMKEVDNNKQSFKMNKTELFFALGKAFEDITDYKKSFNYYSKGNVLRKKNINFSIGQETVIFNNIKKEFNKFFFKKKKNFGFNDDTAIFIIGMPRSGTTLVEQILSNHPNVYGGDELNFLNDIVEKKFFQNNGEINQEILNNNDKLIKYGKEYIRNLKKLSKNSKKITDKLPINFKWIGLIKLILPNSKIIHCYRNSKDNCLSIFKNYFPKKDLNFAYDLKDITSFYNLYLDLMKHWKHTLPDFIFDVKYEKLINDPNDTISLLLKNCNLEWDYACVEYYKNKRTIKTASDTQARKKMYKDSIDSWKNYKSYLDEPFKNLKN